MGTEESDLWDLGWGTEPTPHHSSRSYYIALAILELRLASNSEICLPLSSEYMPTLGLLTSFLKRLLNYGVFTNDP